MTKLIGTDPNQVPSNADLGTLAYQNDDNVSLGLTTIATEGDSTRQGSGTLLRIKRIGNGTWATLAIEAQTYRGNSRIAFVDSDHPNDVGTTGTANGGGAAPFIFDYEHENGKFQIKSNANTRLTIDSTGNFGIGMDSPATALHVDPGYVTLGTSSGTDNSWINNVEDGNLELVNEGRSTNEGAVRINRKNNPAGDTTYFRDTVIYDGKSNVVLFVDGSEGNVGIGTDSPSGKFTVSNDGEEGIEFFPRAASGVNSTQHYDRNASVYLKNRTIALNHEWVNGTTDPAMNLIPDGNSTFLVVKAKAATFSSTANVSLYGTNPNINGGSLVSRATVQAQTDGTAFGTKLRLLTNNTSNVETRAITIDAAQKVGIGTDSPTENLHVYSSTSNADMMLESAASGSDARMFLKRNGSASRAFVNFQDSDTSAIWYTGLLRNTNDVFAIGQADDFGTDTRFVIDNSGNVGIGITDSSNYGARLNVKMSGGSNNAMIASINSSTSGTRRHIDFFDGSGTSRKGAIETNGTSTTYSTTSDRRLKDNIQPITDATEKLMTMNPVTHTWISSPDEPRVHGFIAQEMQEVVPEAISGDKDSEEMMSMDYGRITPVLVAALQEANKKISELEARLNDAGL